MTEQENNLRAHADDLSRANKEHPLQEGDYPTSELDRWAHMYTSEGKYSERSLQQQIDYLKNILSGKGKAKRLSSEEEAKAYSYSITRDLNFRIQLQERQRLKQSLQKQQETGKPIAILRTDPQHPDRKETVTITPEEALERMEDLDWRIRGNLYQDLWINLLLEEVQRYDEALRSYPSLKELPRDVELEQSVRGQLLQLQKLLEQSVLCVRLRRLRNEHAPDAQIQEVLQQLPQEADGDLNAYMTTLDTRIQEVLSATVGFPLQSKKWLGLKKETRTIEVPPVFRLRSDLMKRQMDALLQREDALSGKMDDASSAEKKLFATEHQQLIGDYLEYNALHLRKFRQLLHLLIEPGPIFATEEGSGEPAHEFPPAGAVKTDLLQQRERELTALDTYLEHMDKSVLSNQVLEVDKLFEDIFMTVAVPGGINAAFNQAELVTLVWEIHDAPWRWIPGQVLGKWTPQIGPWRRQRIMAPLYKHFRLPPTTNWDQPTNEEPRYYHELSPAEKSAWLKRADVQERVESVRKIVRRFREQLAPEIETMHGANSVLKDLLSTPAPSSPDRTRQRSMQETLREKKKLPEQLFAQSGEDITEPTSDWPGNRSSEQILQEILAADTAAGRGMYFRLIERATSGRGKFEEIYAEYIRGVNDNLKFHIDARDLHNYARANIWKEAFYVICTIVGETAAAAYLSWKLTKLGITKGPKALWKTTKLGARQIKKGADALGEESRLRAGRTPSSKPSAPEASSPRPSSTPAEASKPLDPKGFESRVAKAAKELESAPARAVKPTSKVPVAKAAPRVGPLAGEAAAAETVNKSIPSLVRKTLSKYLGPAAIVLTAWELKNAIQLAASLEQLPDLKAVDAAIELMETHPEINREAPQFQRDLQFLYQRRQLIAMRDVMENLAVTLEEKIKEYDPKRARSLAKRGRDLAGFARQQDRDLHLRFPITDHIERGRNDPEGVLRVDYASLNGAREDGARNAKRLDQRKDADRFLGPRKSFEEITADLPATDFSALKTAHEHFMEDVAAYLGKREPPKHESLREWLDRKKRDGKSK